MLGISCSSAGVALLILLVVICAVSGGARYRVKFIAFVVLSAIAATWPIPLMLLRPRNWRNALIPAWVLAELWPVLERCTVVAKKVILYFGPFGIATWLWGTIFIDRTKVAEAQNTVNSTATEIVRRKAKLLIFPEGKRHSGNTLLPFKKGAFHVAIRAQTPIQPVVVSKYHFLNSKAKKFGSGTSYITILPPIPTEGLTKVNLPELMDKAYQAMNAKFQETSQESLAEYKTKAHHS